MGCWPGLRFRFWAFVSILGALGAWPLQVGSAPALPPPPDRFVADRAGALRPATRDELNRRLEQFERDSSSQIVVWIERKLPSDTTLEGFVHDVFRHWRIGQARTNNGILLAVFLDDRKVRIEVGRGLEGTFPDVLAGRIVRDEITPRFRVNDFDGGVRAGVAGILAATRGEYRGTGSTVRDRGRLPGTSGSTTDIFFFFVVLLIAVVTIMARSRGALRRARDGGWTYYHGGSTSNWGGGGGGWGGGGDSGGFSGGGGDSGGGGASGSW